MGLAVRHHSCMMAPITDSHPLCNEMDAHYTPRMLASELIATAHDVRPTIIADLCAGRGDLLLQAETVWPQANYAAVDIDPSVVRHLKRLRPTWDVGRCDLLNPRARTRSPVLKLIRGRVSLLLLNPPFSCRGNTRYRIDVPDRPIYASAAMSFLLTSLVYLHTSGVAVAILPYGVLHNQKDREAWRHITKRYSVSALTTSPRQSFPRASVKLAIVRLTPSRTPTFFRQTLPAVDPPSEIPLRARVIRGCQPIHLIPTNPSGPKLIHSTDLHDATVQLNGRRGIRPHRTIIGPAVLLPRVGRITTSKIAVFYTSVPIVLSDCVIAVTTQSLDDARTLRHRLSKHFPILEAQYVGTGAPFITIDRLTAVLATLGVQIDGR